MADLISVVIPTYNRADTVVAAVESALSQTYPHREIIVVDDGSKDDTVDRLQSYLDRIRLIQQANAGKSAAMNRALCEARGVWYAILDSDDLWLPDKLQLQMEGLALTEGKAGMSFTDGIYMGNPSLDVDRIGTFFEQAGKHFSNLHGFVEDSISYVLNPPHGIFGQSAVFRKDILEACGGFDEKLVMAEDTDIFFRVALKTSFAFVNRVLIRVDRTPTRKEGLAKLYAQVTPVAVRCRTHMYEKWLAMETPLTESQRKAIHRRLGAVYHDAALCHLVENRSSEALSSFRRAIELDRKPRYLLKRFITQVYPAAARMLLTRSARPRPSSGTESFEQITSQAARLSRKAR